MKPPAILAELLECGITPSLSADGKGIAVPARTLSPAQRAAVLACKHELIQYLQHSSRLTVELIEAAMAVCDAHGDGEQARADMRADVTATPPALRRELLEHLQAEARKAATGTRWTRRVKP